MKDYMEKLLEDHERWTAYQDFKRQEADIGPAIKSAFKVLAAICVLLLIGSISFFILSSLDPINILNTPFAQLTLMDLIKLLGCLLVIVIDLALIGALIFVIKDKWDF